jgi:hypothetical protein
MEDGGWRIEKCEFAHFAHAQETCAGCGNNWRNVATINRGADGANQVGKAVQILRNRKV